MSPVLADAHFLRPWWGLLVLLWAPLLWWWGRHGRGDRALRRLVDAPLLAHVTVGAPGAGHRAWRVVPWLAAALATLALAGPTWSRLPQASYRQDAAQVVVVSLSPRMLATDVKPDRMRRVRYKVHDLLHANPDGSNALVAYAGAAFVVAPLSADAHALDELVNALSPRVMPVAGDDAAAAIRTGERLLRRAGQPHGQLVMVTDTAGRDARAAAQAAHRKGVQVSVLGVGAAGRTPVRTSGGQVLRDGDGQPLMATRDDAALRALAAAGGGVYVPMDDDGGDIEALRAAREHAGDHVAARHRVSQWRDMGPWLLLPLLALVALGFRRGWLLVLPLVLLPWLPARAVAAGPAPAASTAASWSWWWRNGDQRAAAALRDGDAARARRAARSPAMRGAAAFRDGDLAAAARDFGQLDDADGWYNLGNTLAGQHKYKRAIAAWGEALQRDPDMADAKANRDAVRQWLKQQQDATGNGRDRKGNKGDGTDGHGGKGTSGKQRGDTSTSRSRDGTSAPQDHARGADGQRGDPGTGHDGGDGARGDKPATPAGAGSTAASSPRGPASAASRTDPPSASSSGFDLGRPAPATSSALPVPMEKALQRVRDDPGGLLRRKFELEYRQRRAAAGHREDTP